MLEFTKPTVLCDNEFGCYLYYIPREYLCNIKIVRQFKLAIENLAHWGKNANKHEEAWYTHNDSKLNVNYESLGVNGENNHIVTRNVYPEWLLGSEIKIVDLLNKFPELHAIVRDNVPNSCSMQQYENGNSYSDLHTANEKFFNTKLSFLFFFFL